MRVAACPPLARLCDPSTAELQKGEGLPGMWSAKNTSCEERSRRTDAEPTELFRTLSIG